METINKAVSVVSFELCYSRGTNTKKGEQNTDEKELDPNNCLVAKRGDLFKGFKGLLLHKTFIQRPGQCKMKTMDCRLRTGGKTQTADHV